MENNNNTVLIYVSYVDLNPSKISFILLFLGKNCNFGKVMQSLD